MRYHIIQSAMERAQQPQYEGYGPFTTAKALWCASEQEVRVAHDSGDRSFKEAFEYLAGWAMLGNNRRLEPGRRSVGWHWLEKAE